MCTMSNLFEVGCEYDVCFSPLVGELSLTDEYDKDYGFSGTALDKFRENSTPQQSTQLCMGSQSCTITPDPNIAEPIMEAMLNNQELLTKLVNLSTGSSDSTSEDTFLRLIN